MEFKKSQRPLRLIPQQNSTDCGVACVAMICGVSYKAAFKAMFPQGSKKNFRTHYKDLKRGISALGRRHAPRAAHAPSEWKRMKCTAIVRTGNGADWNWHWVVFDSVQGRLLDPKLNHARVVVRPSRKMTSYLEVYSD